MGFGDGVDVDPIWVYHREGYCAGSLSWRLGREVFGSICCHNRPSDILCVLVI